MKDLLEKDLELRWNFHFPNPTILSFFFVEGDFMDSQFADLIVNSPKDKGPQMGSSGSG